MSKEYVRCCDVTKTVDSIYIKDDEIHFYLSTIDNMNILFCPWCGVLLDLNLEMSPETPLE